MLEIVEHPEVASEFILAFQYLTVKSLVEGQDAALTSHVDRVTISIRQRSAARTLFLSERVSNLIRERFRQKRHHGSRRRLYECLNGHSGDQLQVSQPRDLAGGYSDPKRIVTRSGLLIFTHVGGNLAHDTIDFGCRALAEIREAQHGGLPDMNLVDVLRLNFGFDVEQVQARNDQHDLFTG